MEITPKTSKKRKQSSSSATHLNNYPISGVLTRQKTQKYFFNHNRSGKSRKCTSFPQFPPKNSPEIDGNLVEIRGSDSGGDGCGDGGCVSIKDLRARRVFSKPPKKGKLGKIEKGKFEIGDNSADLIDVNPNLFDVNGVVNSIVQELNCENPNLFDDLEEFESLIDSGNPNLCKDLEKCDLGFNDINPNLFDNLGEFDSLIDSGNPDLSKDLEKCDFGFNDLNANLLASEKNGDSSANLVAESLNDGGLNQLIPPEKCVLVGGNGKKFSDAMSPNLSNGVLQGRVVENREVVTEETVQTTPPETAFINQKSDDGCGEVKNFSNSRKEMALPKCLRRKVFKVPNSFTYKRLLPYLMDMAKDEACELPAKASVETEMNVEEKSVVSISEKCSVDGPRLSEKPVATIAVCVPLEVATSPGSQMDLVPNESRVPDDSNQDSTQNEHISPDNLLVTLDSPRTSPESSKKDVLIDTPCHSSVNSEGECKAGDIEFKADEITINKSNSSNPDSTMIKKLIDSVTLNFPVLKKYNFGFSDPKPNLRVSEKNVDSRVDLVAEVDGDLNQLMLPVKCVSESGNGEKFADAMSPSWNKDLVEGKVLKNCAVEDDETVQTTPPEAVLVIRKSDEDSVYNVRSYASRPATKEMSPSKDGCGDVKNFSNSRKEMTLSKCSRRKVFKVPNSFTYKRLLPYLTDMVKDEPREFMASPTVQTEMDVDENPVACLSEKPLSTVAACVPQNVSIDLKDEQSDDRNTISPSGQTDMFPSEAKVPDDLKHDVPQNEQISPEIFTVTLDIPMMSSGASMKDICLEPPCDLSVDSGGEYIAAADIKFKAEESTVNKSNSSDKLAIVVSSDAPFAGPTKGILKRNPRGCRGICSCLNCSSFRLNAEKAFEFSRNQMLEAGELTQDLMKEISNLSCMLKKSVQGNIEAESVRVTQVKEACRRASNVEDMAKSRLHQMHEDLFVHCRTKVLHRPRVNFSGNVQDNGDAGELTMRDDRLISPWRPGT